MNLRFSHSQSLTLGAELELQVLNRDSLCLSSSSPQILEFFKDTDRIKAEIFQSMVEITTGICTDAHQVNQQLKMILNDLICTCKSLNLCVASAGRHPSADWRNCEIFPDERYQKIFTSQKWVAKHLLIFGLHVHIGMRSGEHAIQMTNALLHHLPLFLALSSSSPFMKGIDTQLSSSRITSFESLPTGGHPCTFKNWADFKSAYTQLYRANSIQSSKDLWWDIRPSPLLGTVEIRICDSPATIAEATAIVALIHMVAQKIDSDILTTKQTIPPPPDWVIRENKWRVARHGIHAELISSKNIPTKKIKDTLNELLEDLHFFTEVNNYHDQMELLKKITLRGSSADRQRRIYDECSSLVAVTKRLVRELETDTPNWSTSESLNY